MKPNDSEENNPCPDDMFEGFQNIPDENFEKLADAIIAQAVRDAISHDPKYKIDNPKMFLSGKRGLVSQLWFTWAKRRFMREGALDKINAAEVPHETA